MRKVAALVVLTLLAACSGSDDEGATTTTSSSSTTTEAAAPDREAPAGPDLAAASVRFTEVGRFEQPLAMAFCGPTTYVAEKVGTVRRLDGGSVADLEVSDGNEQGLLGIACSPWDDGIYVSYTDPGGDTRLDHLDVTSGALGNLFAVEQPAANHNGGHVLGGPDGALWFGLGDGGGADDRFSNAQEPGEVLGSILRFTGPAAEPDIVVKGVRNPWRYSFDRETGDLWIGDVGQNQWEEIDRLPAGEIDGANLGWPAFEGAERYREDVPAPPGAIRPVFVYGRDEGVSVAGGYVYRGESIPALRGAYLFTDTYNSVLRAIVVDADGAVTQQRALGEIPGGRVASFAEGIGGELYVLSLAGGIYRLDP